MASARLAARTLVRLNPASWPDVPGVVAPRITDPLLALASLPSGRRTSSRLALVALASLPFLSGCRSSALEARVSELEVARDRLELRVDELVADRSRWMALEASLASRPDVPVADLTARITALEAQVLSLEDALRRAHLAALDRPAAPRPAPPQPGGAPPDATIPGPPGARGAPPPAGATIEVLSVGSGGLLLIRTPNGLDRVQLRGIDPPARADGYERDPSLRARHGEAWGPHAILSDRAFELSRVHLEDLLRGATVTLADAPDAPARAASGAVVAWVLAARDGGAPIDVNAAMLRDGFALLERGTARDADLQRLEAEARAARRGVFGPND